MDDVKGERERVKEERKGREIKKRRWKDERGIREQEKQIKEEKEGNEKE